MLIPSELFCWLRGLRLIQTKDFQALADTQAIDERDEKEILYGVTALRLIDKICTIKRVEYLKLNVDEGVPVFSKAKMILNWRTAFQMLPKLGLSLDPELLSLVQNGDEAMMIDVLNTVYHRFGKKVDLQEQDEMETLKHLGLSESRAGQADPREITELRDQGPETSGVSRFSTNDNRLVPLNLPRAKSSMIIRKPATSRNVEIKYDSQFIKPNLPTLNSSTITRNFSLGGGRLNITDFNLSVSTQLIPVNIKEIELQHPDPQNVNHLFEYLLLTVAECFNLKVSNVVPIFAGGGKVLANLIVKGIRYDGFKGVVKWFQTLRENTNRIFEMILMDPSWSTLKLFLTTIKPGLISKSADVADVTLQMFTRLALLLKERNLMAPAYAQSYIVMSGLWAAKA
jgi:hypothetical protein